MQLDIIHEEKKSGLKMVLVDFNNATQKWKEKHVLKIGISSNN